MEGLNLAGAIAALKQFGIPGLIIVLWWFDSRYIRKILDRYKSDMADLRRMYESNVSLVKDYHEVARDLKDVVIMNTQAMQHLVDSINNNQYCPQVRLKKQAQGVQNE